MKLSRGAIALYVGLVFVCGGVLGFFANRLYTVSTVSSPATGKNPPNPEEYRKSAVAEYKRRMSMTDAQVLNLNLILDESRAKVQAEQKAQRERSRPLMQKILLEQTERISAMLTPEQRTEYEKILAERREQQRQKASEKNKGSGPHGPGF